ncbi:MAG: 5-(carboxyamino)imidazole ribonucleotide mutase [Vicingaceae bacterium]|jgi:5-(carboxyamino)imidazole ribonucleotide mutase
MGAKIGIIMGSISDLKVMQVGLDFLKEQNIAFEVEIVSAHRTPEKMLTYAKTAKDRGLKVIVAAAGGAAHLPGMVAASTPLPVIGVPIKSSNSIDGWDSILSILQMPSGVPVATVALDGAKNAAILAAQILATSDDSIAAKMDQFKIDLVKKVAQMNEELNSKK